MLIKQSDTKRVLVTGAAGFIGRHCLPILASMDFEVHAVDLVQLKEPDMAYWHPVDLLDAKQTRELIKKIRPTHLLHFAWYAKPGEYWNSIENLRWLEGSLHLIRAFQESGGERLVVAGTCAEYDWNCGFCSEYITPLTPSKLYGTCKHSLHLILNSFSQIAGLSSAWGRIFFLYGPHENANRLVSSIILNLLNKKVAPCTHGNQIRDFLYVKDVASAFVSLLMSDVRGPVNIASGRPVTIREVALTIADCFNERERVQFGVLPSPENEPLLIVGDRRRLSNEVGWHPNYDLATSIEETVRFWQDRCYT
jgi:nucleoside-diphosphate-sugar epimerase